MGDSSPRVRSKRLSNQMHERTALLLGRVGYTNARVSLSPYREREKLNLEIMLG